MAFAAALPRTSGKRVEGSVALNWRSQEGLTMILIQRLRCAGTFRAAHGLDAGAAGICEGPSISKNSRPFNVRRLATQ